MSTRQRVIVIGDIDIARRTCTTLAWRGDEVVHLLRPNEGELQQALTTDLRAVAVLVRSDVTALRYALLAEHLKPHVRLVVMLFDRTVADQLLRTVPNCQVTSPADITVPAIVGACLGKPVLAVDTLGPRTAVVTETFDGTTVTPWRAEPRLRRIWRAFTQQFRPHDLTSRLLLIGLAGLTTTLLIEWLLAVLVLHHPAIEAFATAARIVATVGPGEHEPTPGWYLVVSSIGMLLTIGYSALFTAGIVNRFLSYRSIDIIGLRTLPSRDHVVVVGLGQVSLRLCMALRRLHIPVLAIERNPRAANLRLAKAAGIPVLIAHAEDRDVLRRLSLHRARAFAAMGADDLDNVEAAIAALAHAPGLRVVLRAGDHAVITETRSLFPIGDVCDISTMTVRAIAASVNGFSPRFVFPHAGKLITHPPAPTPRTATEEPTARCTCDQSPALDG